MSSYTPASKKSKFQANDNRDLISKLPQDVIGHILSRLTSKDAMRTSVLSKDWVYRWTSSYNIDIDDKGANMKKRKKITNFVDKMLRGSHDLKSLCFLCHYMCNSARLTASICIALRRNTESFEIQFPHSFELPKGFINNTSLRNLKLMPAPYVRNFKPNPSCTFRVTRDNCFPNLTSLYLKGVEILNDYTDSDCLVFSLPVLRTLELLHCKWSNVKLMEFHSPALTTFICMKYPVAREYTTNIIGARLAKFESCGGFHNIILTDSEVRTAALMNVWVPDLQTGLQFQKLMEGFSGVRDLKLSSSVCEAIALSIQERPLPRYDQLERLVMTNVELLLKFLHSTPSLKFLEIETYEYDACGHDFEVVDPVPYCILSHLEEVNINCHHSNETVPLAKFMLKNGVVLKKLGLYAYKSGRFSTNEVVEQLLLYPRASAFVEIFAR